MLIYFLVFAVVCALGLLSAGFRNAYVRRLCCFFAFSTLILFGGLRWDMWTDWWQYEHFFYNTSFIENDFEIGYFLANKLISGLGFSYTGFLLIFYLVILSILLWCVYEYSPRFYALSLIVYCSLFFLTSGGARQHIALFVFLLSIKYIAEKRFWWFLIFLLIGSLFHRTILLLFPIYWIDKLKLNKWILIVSLVVAIILSKFNILSVLLDFVIQHTVNDGGPFIRRINFYFTQGLDGVSVGLGFLRKVLVLAMCYIIYNRSNNSRLGLYLNRLDDEYYKKLFILVKIYFMGVVLSLIIYGIFGRILTYLYFVECLLIPMVARSVKSRYILAFLLIILLVYTLGFVQSLGVFGRNSSTITDSLFFPYRSIFD